MCGRDQPAGVAGLGAHGAEDIEIIVLGLADRPRPRAHLGPHARDRAVLAEAGLVLVVGQDALARVGGPDLASFSGNSFF